MPAGRADKGLVAHAVVVEALAGAERLQKLAVAGHDLGHHGEEPCAGSIVKFMHTIKTARSVRSASCSTRLSRSNLMCRRARV